MKSIVEKIFGKEASEDKDIVSFYEDVQKLAMDEYANEKNKVLIEILSHAREDLIDAGYSKDSMMIKEIDKQINKDGY